MRQYWQYEYSRELIWNRFSVKPVPPRGARSCTGYRALEGSLRAIAPEPNLARGGPPRLIGSELAFLVKLVLLVNVGNRRAHRAATSSRQSAQAHAIAAGVHPRATAAGRQRRPPKEYRRGACTHAADSREVSWLPCCTCAIALGWPSVIS